MQREPRKADRMEQQPPAFYERVREGYRELATQQQQRIVLINGSQDPDQIEREIWMVLSHRFPILNTRH
jgi:dTMP kinase